MCMSPGSLVHTTLPSNMSVYTINIYTSNKELTSQEAFD